MKDSSGGPVGVVYSPVTMMTVAAHNARSRMNRPPCNSSISRLTRCAAVVGCCLLSSALFGASKASHKPAGVPQSTPVNNVDSPNRSASRELMHDVSTPAPVDGDAVLASAILPAIGSQEKVLWMEVTAYCGCKKCCGSHAQGLTASGKPITYNDGHFVAADKKLFKFGAKLQVPGYADGQPVEVIDRGGAIKGSHIDVFFPTHEQAREWGRRWIAVTLVQ